MSGVTIGNLQSQRRQGTLVKSPKPFPGNIQHMTHRVQAAASLENHLRSIPVIPLASQRFFVQRCTQEVHDHWQPTHFSSLSVKSMSLGLRCASYSAAFSFLPGSAMEFIGLSLITAPWCLSRILARKCHCQPKVHHASLACHPRPDMSPCCHALHCLPTLMLSNTRASQCSPLPTPAVHPSHRVQLKLLQSMAARGPVLPQLRSFKTNVGLDYV